MLIRSFMVFLLFVPATSAAQWGPCGAKRDEVLQMGRRIEKELPYGSTEEQVAKFLDGMQLQHGQAGVDRHEPLRKYRRLRQMGSTIETPAHNEPAMYLKFYFDRRRKLVEWNVRNACGLGCYSLRGKARACFAMSVGERDRTNRWTRAAGA